MEVEEGVLLKSYTSIDWGVRERVVGLKEEGQSCSGEESSPCEVGMNQYVEQESWTETEHHEP